MLSLHRNWLCDQALTIVQTQGAPYEVHADYLIAADGASSRIRKQLGIRMIGEPAMQHLVNIHFFSKELWQHVRERPAMLYFVFSKQAIVVLVAHDLQAGEMVAQVCICVCLSSGLSQSVSEHATAGATAPGAFLPDKADYLWHTLSPVLSHAMSVYLLLALSRRYQLPCT